MPRPADLLRSTVESQSRPPQPLDVDALVRRRRAEQNLKHAAESLTRSQRSLAAVLVQQGEAP